MCPACIATVGWIAAGATSTGGIAALVVSRLRGKNKERDMDKNKERNDDRPQKERNDDRPQDRNT
jgi:hypothetical protein